ncbi:hypothetical protein PAXINDRAFT_21816 [Paxillus involutus ATCC 200175]|uniref:Uncharacterized protein n=1 Tax=Paxillus involutus ATCC 200175 TaxID=664439 RepID=A0A0C9SLR8_PAXIN|nr:hypothetical protein PAXINDRAFT_21816 [Paxillus involutus ATCC 200175]
MNPQGDNPCSDPPPYSAATQPPNNEGQEPHLPAQQPRHPARSRTSRYRQIMPDHPQPAMTTPALPQQPPIPMQPQQQMNPVFPVTCQRRDQYSLYCSYSPITHHTSKPGCAAFGYLATSTEPEVSSKGIESKKTVVTCAQIVALEKPLLLSLNNSITLYSLNTPLSFTGRLLRVESN